MQRQLITSWVAGVLLGGGLVLGGGLEPGVAQVVTDPKTAADQLFQQGIQQFQVSQFREALQSWEQALAIYREIGDLQGEAASLGNLGIAYLSLGQYQRAIDYYEQYLAIAREIGDRQGEANSLGNLGIAYFSLGQYQRAIDYHEQSLAIAREIGDRQGEAASLGSLGIAYDSLGQYQRAIDYHEQSLAIKREIGDRQGEANSLGNLGIAYFSLGQYQRAIDYHEQSLAIKREIGDRQGEANSLGNLGNAYDSLGQYQRAIDYHEQQLAIAREIGDRQGEANSLNNLAAVSEQLGDYDQALAFYQQGLTLFREIQARDGEGKALGNIGGVLGQQNQPELAIIFYKQSVNLREAIRSDLRGLSLELQQSYTDTVASDYRSLADLLLQQGRIPEALRVLDLLKVQELDNFLSGMRGSNNSRQGVPSLPPETAIAVNYNDLVDRAIRNSQDLRQLEQPGIPLTPAELERLASLQTDQDQLLQAFNAFVDSPAIQSHLDELKVKDPDETDRNLALTNLSDLQNNLADLNQNAVLLYPLILGDRLELILVTPNTPPIRRTSPIAAADLNRLVGELRYTLSDPNRDAQAPAQKLYDVLIRPLAEDLVAVGAKTLIYAPDRALRYVPIAALHDGQHWLAETYRTYNITAASIDDLNATPTPEPHILAAAFTTGEYTITVGSNTYPYSGLPNTAKELAQLQTLTPQNRLTTYQDTAFTPAIIRLRANSHHIVHLATHAQFEPGPPEQSFILFGDGSIKTLADLKAGWLNLTNVDLVVLSACETALDGTLKDGAEILALGYLMQQAGSKSTLASLWKVDDGGTQALMGYFYEALLDGHQSKAEALHQAQLALIQAPERTERGSFVVVTDAQGKAIDPTQLSHPYYWAPFILIGNGR
ncbi:tetratricopeptide repeat protein [Prochlorothrix hollandica]|uniref:tetratricopeptide repeat protein n=1 Tax=Prochlorothrix hollandica TaxID=1223 RepID=UPI00034D4185|nr:tetratricopeptide repeat protein [Prochlorothrix hollandica]